MHFCFDAAKLLLFGDSCKFFTWEKLGILTFWPKNICTYNKKAVPLHQILELTQLNSMMKKILLMAVAAVMFVACNENGPSSTDKKTANVVSSEAIALIGQNLAKVDKALTDAGYVKATSEAAKAAPARVRAMASMAEAMNVLYVYGLPENINQMSEAEYDACMTKAIQEGGTIAMAYVFADGENKLTGIQTTMYLKLTSGANKLYTDVSNKLFAQIPAGAIPETMPTGMPSKFPFAMWQGGVSTATSSDEKEDVLETTDHAEFIAKIAANTSLQASEYALLYASQEGDGWTYQTMWVNPSEEEQKEMQEEIGFAVAYGMFIVADIHYMKNIL